MRAAAWRMPLRERQSDDSRVVPHPTAVWTNRPSGLNAGHLQPPDLHGPVGGLAAWRPPLISMQTSVENQLSCA